MRSQRGRGVLRKNLVVAGIKLLELKEEMVAEFAV